MRPTPLRRRLGNARRAFARRSSAALAPVGFAYELVLALRTRSRIAAFQQRGHVAKRFAEARRDRPPERVVAVVTHVADPERDVDSSVERLVRTYDSLIESLNHTELELVLNTTPGRHVAGHLPQRLRERVVLREHGDVDPMLVGFRAQDAFAERGTEADWFVYLEDDIVVADSFLLGKLAFFNERTPADALLLPHRYELLDARKTYIDLVSKRSPVWVAWNELTVLQAGPWRFAEFENPHSGFYCLSQAQLQRWLATGRRWSGKISYVAARESAATGSLAEAFRLYKPHPDNMTFLEVRHWDTKYSELYGRLHSEENAPARP